MKYFPLSTSTLVAFCLMAIVFCAGCNNKKQETQSSESSNSASQQEVTKAVPVDSLKSIPASVMRDLWQNCDAVDIIFFQDQFSLSQDEKGSIQNLLGYFLPTPVKYNPACKPIGRITFLVQGEIRQEADIHLSDQCQYYIWIRDNKPVAINSMAPQGVTFFDQIRQKGHGLQQGVQ